MRRILTALALCAVGFTAAGIEPASADITYPWCAQYRGGDRGGGRNCGFWTYGQCMAAVSGMGGYCEANAMYRGPQPGMIPPPTPLPPTGGRVY
ncbi:MAG TPA: DUF3551 domain-containing protein [Xanthobacteraceae bacterium]|nr:DUF3551 domain-containing protein [Xanthobacteraceae bacterium]